MSGVGETKKTSVIRNTVAAGITALVIAAAVGTPVAVNASNQAHTAQIQEMSAAKDATLVTRAAGQQDTVLAQSAIDADTLAKHEAAVKQQEAEAAAAALAAKKAAEAKAALDAAQQAAVQQSTVESAPADSSSPAPTDTGITCPAGEIPTGYSSPGVVTSCGQGDACQEYSSPGVCVRWLPGYKP